MSEQLHHLHIPIPTYIHPQSPFMSNKEFQLEGQQISMTEQSSGLTAAATKANEIQEHLDLLNGLIIIKGLNCFL